MRFVHISDLHLGKKFNEISLIEDQKKVLDDILEITKNQKADGVFIAGDIYDKGIPPEEAVKLFDDFLTKLADLDVEIFLISGNHDSSERISFGGRLMRKNVHIAPVFTTLPIAPVSVKKGGKTINVYMLPFIKPVHVKNLFREESKYFIGDKLEMDVNVDEIATYTDAFKIVVDSLDINKKDKNVLIMHQFLSGGRISDSEEVGGLEEVSSDLFKDFDYVALGHLHRPQNVGKNKHIRYCGTPLKYSFSEMDDKKSVTIVDIENDVKISEVPLVPLRDIREIKGTLEEIKKMKGNKDDFVKFILTDEEQIPGAMNVLKQIYKNGLQLSYEKEMKERETKIDLAQKVENKSIEELFEEFYKQSTNEDMSEQQKDIIKELVEEIKNKEEVL